MRDTDAGVVDLLNRHLDEQAKVGRPSGKDFRIGLIGRGIQQSRSPFMHEREGQRLGLRYSYSLIDFDQLGLPDAALGEIVDAARQLGFAGLNVTHPYKQAVIEHLTSLSLQAQSIGAVNTIVFTAGEAVGHNTDSWGFAESFRIEMPDLSPGSVTQFGAGGAGAAVAHALIDLGAQEIVIVDQVPTRAEELASRMAARHGGRIRATRDVFDALARGQGIVNTTPVGMAKYPGTPFPANLLSSAHWVGEIVYFPQETELLRIARGLGCRTLGGTGMAVYQAVRAFELFTGIEPDRAAMIQHFEAAA